MTLHSTARARCAAALLSAAAVAACRPAPGFTAAVDGGAWHEQWAGSARARICPSRGVILFEGDGPEQQGIALVWYFGHGLGADSVPLGRPIERAAGDSDSTRSAASAALRRVLDVNVIGYQSRYGSVRIARPDSARVSAAFTGVFDRLGVQESLRVSGRFDAVRPVPDTTLCAVPPAAHDSGVALTR
jgi:hypothetical protein